MSDDLVYFTAGGGRWHERADCEALANGQLEAASNCLPNHPIQRVPPSGVGDRTPCGWCVMSDVPLDKVAPAPPVDDLKTETEYERVFADHVLRPLAELSAWTVESQKSVTINGRTYRPDFALTLSPLRIAIEIDGKDKGPGSDDHDAWTRRQTALVNAGWEVLRFTNRQVMHEQEYCRRQIAVAVARLQERAQGGRRGTAPAQQVAPTQPRSPVAPPPPPQPASKAPLWAAAGAAVAVAVVAVIVLSGGGDGSGTAPQGGSCAASEPVKGNISQSGEKIYHQPGDAFYERTVPEECFSDGQAAEAAGYRAAKR